MQPILQNNHTNTCFVVENGYGVSGAPCKSSFIPNWNNEDNIIIVQEVIHIVHNKMTRKRWIAIKIYLEKAYGKLKFAFVIDTLRDIGLPDNFVGLVYKCISTTNMCVLWNGEMLEAFKPS